MLASIITCLLSTLMIECSILYILGVRSRRDLLTAVYANALTNPVVVFLANMLFAFAPSYAWGSILVLEIGAVLTEGFIFKYYFTRPPLSPWTLSFIANLVSFETGFVLNYFHIVY